jgi:transposase
MRGDWVAAREVDLFGVRVSFVEQWWRRYRTVGDIAPKAYAGGQRPRLDPNGQMVVRGVLHDHPDATLVERCAAVATATGVRVDVATLCHLLQRLEWRRKRPSTRPSATRHVFSKLRGLPPADGHCGRALMDVRGCSRCESGHDSVAHGQC